VLKESQVGTFGKKINQPAPVWIALLLASLLIACTAGAGFLYQKSSENFSQIEADLRNLSLSIQYVDSDIDLLESDVRLLKFDSSDFESFIGSLQTSVEKLQDLMLTVCVWVSIRQGRYIC